MALIYQLAIGLKDGLAERFGAKMDVTDNCAGQFFTLDRPLTDDIKKYVTDYLSELKHVPIFWDEASFSVRDLTNHKHQ